MGNMVHLIELKGLRMATENQARTVTDEAQATALSIVAPVYNEASSIAEFVKRVLDTMEGLKERALEIILVDDGSSDNSLEIMQSLAQAHDQLRVMELRRNYGQTAALQAGMDAAKGAIIVTMDADLQHFPEEIPSFLQEIKRGADMVCGWRRERAEGVIRRWPSKVANYLIRRISGLQIHDFGTTFRAYRAAIIKDIRLYGEFHRYIPVLGKGVGARITEIPIKNIIRPSGASNYGLGRTFGVFLDLILLSFLVKYMDRPMRIFGKIASVAFGFASAILVGLFIYGVIYNVAAVRERSGWYLMSIMLYLAAVQILLSGILAEILVRIHFGQGDRRVYRVREEWSARETD